jgi:SAM-dependent methyltransferase
MRGKKNFWDTQYKKPTHLELSDEASEDLEKFARYLVREHGKKYLNVTTKAVDLGCGNGRNLIYLAKEFGVHGLGYDTSKEAVEQAKKKASGVTVNYNIRLAFEVRSIAEPIPLPDASVMLALDMMSSHVLLRADRERLRSEVLRVLRPEGWLFFKSFLLEEDANAARMLKEFPGPEEGTYMHPEIGVPEYVWTEESLRDFFEPHFTIHKLEKSYKHRRKDGTAWKRRTVSVYLQKV